MHKISSAAAAVLALIAFCAAAQDDFDPNPNRLPGPKIMPPGECREYPEVCQARKEHERIRRQRCADDPGNCPPPPPATPKPVAKKPAHTRQPVATAKPAAATPVVPLAPAAPPKPLHKKISRKPPEPAKVVDLPSPAAPTPVELAKPVAIPEPEKIAPPAAATPLSSETDKPADSLKTDEPQRASAAGVDAPGSVNTQQPTQSQQPFATPGVNQLQRPSEPPSHP